MKKNIIVVLVFLFELANANAQTLSEGSLYKGQKNTDVFLIQNGKKVLIPNIYSLKALGYGQWQVTSTQDTELDIYPTFQNNSASQTPGSLVFDMFKPSGGQPAYFPVQIQEGAQLVKNRRIVELRGWLKKAITDLPKQGNGLHPESKGFDWGFTIIPDFKWLEESQKMDIDKLIMVGNILSENSGKIQGVNPSMTVVKTVGIHCEINSWNFQDRNPIGMPNPPADWVTIDNVVWPFAPPIIDSGTYVRVFGSLVTDNPHCSNPDLWGGVPSLFGTPPIPNQNPKWEVQKWCLCWPWACGCDDDGFARWTEIHPVDKIETDPNLQPAQQETVFAIIATSNVSDCRTISVNLKPDMPRPPNSRLTFKEIIGAESFGWASVGGTKIISNFLTVTKMGEDSINVSGTFCGDNVGSHGRVKGIYRLFWEANPIVTPPPPPPQIIMPKEIVGKWNGVMEQKNEKDEIVKVNITIETTKSGKIIVKDEKGNVIVNSNYSYDEKSQTISFYGKMIMRFFTGTLDVLAGEIEGTWDEGKVEGQSGRWFARKT
jgi:hypothetical protein